jgi:RNA polymerase sigma-70 factor, ECF subfamily
MNSLEDEICTKIRMGDEKAFNILFKVYYSPLCRYAYELLRETEDAKEVVLDVFIKIWETKESLTIKSSLKGYLYRSVHNQCLNHIRKFKHLSSNDFISIDDEKNNILLLNIEVPADILEKLFTEQLEKDLLKALETLPNQCRTIFYLCRFEHLTYPEIASKLNLALSTVKTQMLRAISKLKIEIEKQF